jgi:organic radical activating enzyme
MAYLVTEIFHSLQGEGLNTGRSAIFIRFAGCNWACPGCDDPLHENDSFVKMTAEEILAKVNEFPPAETIILTGGEPGLYDLGPLVEALENITWKNRIAKIHPTRGRLYKQTEFLGFAIWTKPLNGPLICVETNGSRAIQGAVDFICVSPKPLIFAKSSRIDHSEQMDRSCITADEIKVVLGWDTPEDIELFFKRYADISDAQFFVSPLTKFPENTLIQETADQAVELVKNLAYLGVRLSLQTHKWLGVR